MVDNPAQAGAVATLMKSAGDMIMSAKGPTMFDDLRRDWEALGAKLNVLEKAGRDLRNQERRTPYADEEEGEHEYEGEGEEFEKEPIDTNRGDRRRTAAEHEGDWPGAGTKGSARGQRPKTRVTGYVSGDEGDGFGQMTPDRASEVLQPYAQDNADEEEEEKLDEMEDVAKRFRARFPRASDDLVIKASYHAVADANPYMGREREIMKRHQDAQPKSRTYTDEELADRLEKRFGKAAVERARAMYSK